MSDFDDYEKSLLKLNEALTNTEARKFLKKQGKALGIEK